MSLLSWINSGWFKFKGLCIFRSLQYICIYIHIHSPNGARVLFSLVFCFVKGFVKLAITTWFLFCHYSSRLLSINQLGQTDLLGLVTMNWSDGNKMARTEMEELPIFYQFTGKFSLMIYIRKTFPVHQPCRNIPKTDLSYPSQRWRCFQAGQAEHLLKSQHTKFSIWVQPSICMGSLKYETACAETGTSEFLFDKNQSRTMYILNSF